MGKNKRGKGRGQPQRGMRHAAPAAAPTPEPWPRPPHGGFRGLAPARSMGPPGPRFRMPLPPHSRMMMLDDMGDDRRFMHEQSVVNEPLHPLHFPDRPGFRPSPFNDRDDLHFHTDFDDRPPLQRFYPPEYECGPRYHLPDFVDGPPDFYPPEFRGRTPNLHPSDFEGGHADVYPPEFHDRPAFHMMNPEFEPMECYRPRDPSYMPQMDAHDHHAFGERGGFAGPPQDFRGPVPPQPQIFNAANMPPPKKTCPPQPQKIKEPPKSTETKSEPSKTLESKISTLRNITANPPRGRSLGVISFIGNNCGFIERDDLKKFSFAFNAYFGNRAHLVPGVKVHFTAVKNTLGKELATDVKVAPGGTEELDSTVYEGVVTTALPDDNVKEPNPGRIRTIISVDPIKLPFGKEDTRVTLLLYDRVEFQLITNVITKEQRATNIKPKMPETFKLTKEIREMGVVMDKSDGTLTIKAEKHDILTASAADTLSEDELNVKDEVEFTLLTVNDTKKAVRLKKLCEGSVTFNQAIGNEHISDIKENTVATSPVKDKWKPVTSGAGSQESVVSYNISSEKYEGTIVKIAPKNSQTQEKETDKQEPVLGLLVTAVEGKEKKLSFRSGDVITKATMMAGDKVQFNISTNSVTAEESAVNLQILPDTFQTESEEQRKIGLIVKLDDKSGFIKTQQDPQVFFDMSEVMEETKLTLSEKVEFTLVPNEAAAGGNQAVRIRRLNESVFTSAPKLEALGVKEKKKMTIKLLKDPKDKIKEDVNTEDKGKESKAMVKPNTGKDKTAPSLTLMGELKKERDIKQEKTKTKDDRARSRSRENSRRRYSRSRSRESDRRRYSRSRSRSRDRSSRRYRSSSRERRDSRYRRSRSRELPKGYRRSNSRSRSRERSSRSARRRSRTPENRDDRYKKQSGSKESSNRKRAKSPEDNVDEELSRKRKELMELNELIARKKAIVAMEQNAKKFEIEVDGPHGVKTFDYQHVHCENLWMPELKPVKSILKKQSELHTEPHFQASTSKETAPLVQSAGIPFACLDSQKSSAFDSNTPVYSTLEGDSEKNLTTAASEKISLPQIEDPELLRKKKQLDELSESIARKRAIIALEQKTKAVQDTPGMKRAFEFDSFSDDQFVTSKENLWSSDVKSSVQPKKSILKKRSELLSSQSDTSVEDYGQTKPSREDSAFTKPSFQSTAASLFDTSSNRQPFHSDTLGLFNKIINESSATLQITDSSPFNKPIVAPKTLTQASKPQSLHDQKPSSMSKGNSSPEDQPRVISSHKHDHPQNSSPSTSQASPSDQKRNVTTQMERFLSALNRADSSIVNSLFQEARKDLALISKPKPPQPQLDRNIPFMDEIYDPFKEDEDKDEPSVMRKDVGRHSLRKLSESQVETETHLEDPIQDDLLPHERAVQDGSGFSRLVGTKCGVQPTAKAKKNIPYDPQMASDNWNTHKANPNWFSEQWNSFEEDKNAAEQKDYADDLNPYREHSRSAEYQNVSPNVQRSYKKDREMPDSKFDKSLARQQSEESNEDKDEKKDQFEKIQNLLQTIGFHLDTGEVNKLADRTRERLYGKTVKPASFHSLDRNREPSMSRSEHGGSSRADSSDTEGIRSVSPAQSSNRKVYMSYKDSVTYRDQHKADVEDVDLTSIKRTVLNLKSAEDTQDPCTPSSEQTTVSPVLYQPTPAHVLSTAEPASSHYAQNPTISTYPASQYSYYSNEQNPWSSAYSLDSSQNASLQYSAYPYGTVPPPPSLGYASYHQLVPPHMMPSYSSYATQMANPYSVGSPLLPNPFVVPPVANPLLCSTETKKTQPVRCLKTIETVKLAAGPARSLVTIEPIERCQTRSMLRDTANKQVATITEDDIKAKQKKRLEQFNQRMKLKKEQQMEAQRSRGQKQNSTPGKSTPNEIKNVWICGHSLVFWAEKRATSPEFGVQLGMHPNSVRIWWKGVQGMTWQQLLPLLLQLKDNWPRPDVLIVHLGGNDISTTAPETFIETVKKDLTSLKSIFPECLVVWSDILSRQSWRDREDSKEMDIIRMAINDNIHQIMSKLGGSALTHDNIRPSLGLYRPDGVHLSGKGIDTFNLNLQDFLEKWESETETKTESSDPSVQDANS